MIARDRLVGEFVFFFNDTATTEIYTLSLHDALPISRSGRGSAARDAAVRPQGPAHTVLVHRHALVLGHRAQDRKSTRLNSSHSQISYAVFCLKKKTATKDSYETHHL